MKIAADHFGAEVVELTGIDKISGHPSVLGMKEIYEEIIEKING
jgi:hypothetical protein